MKRSGIYPQWYHWVVAAGSFLVITMTVGLCYNCWSLFTLPICEGLGLSRQQFSGLYTGLLLGQMLGALWADRLIQRFGMLWLVRSSAVSVTILTAISGMIRSAMQLYAVSFLIGLLLIGTSFYVFSILIADWFHSHRGLVTGIVFMGSGLGSVVLVPLVNHWILTLGWQNARFCMAALLAATVLPACFLLLRGAPQDVGLEPYGAGKRSAVPESPPATGTAVGAASQGTVYAAFLLFVLTTSLVSFLGPTIVPHLQDTGFSSTAAAAVQSAGMASIAAFRVLSGRMCDRLGIVTATGLLSFLIPLLLAGLLLSGYAPWSVVLIVLGQGAVQSQTIVCAPLLTRHLFGEKHYATIYGRVTALSNLSGALAPLIYGGLYTRYGSYAPTFWSFGVLCLLGLCGFFLTFLKKPLWRTTV